MTVSFLIPLYNEERHLGSMLDSLLAQQNPAWEAVVVDDGSTDRTVEIVQDYAARDPRIRLVSHGVKLRKVHAFNRAYQASTGDLVAISGGDDLHPPDAVALRRRALADVPPGERGAAYFKLRMFSEDPRFDGLVLPRGQRGSRSGPSLTLTRPLAELLFPIPRELISEDIWLGEASEDLASHVTESPEVVVHYRVHGGNSNPRHQPFPVMSDAMHDRAQAWGLLLARPDLPLSEGKRRELELKSRAEESRHAGRPIAILRVRGLPLIDRLAMAAMANPLLFRVRTRFYKFFSGRRGR